MERAHPVKRCPICNKPSEAAYRPFCSRRCADVDLHRWLGGQYRIPTEEPAQDARIDDEPRDAADAGEDETR